MYILKILNAAEHESLEFFDRFSIKEKNLVSFLTENELGVYQRKLVHDFLFQTFNFFVSGKCNFCTVLAFKKV